MAKVLAWAEPTWFDRRTEYRIWRHLVRAYDVDFELLAPDEEPQLEGIIVVADEQGKIQLEDFEHPENCTYLFGRTHQNDLIERPHDHSIVISYPGSVCLFGMQAAAIILADRERKRGRND